MKRFRRWLHSTKKGGSIYGNQPFFYGFLLPLILTIVLVAVIS